MKLLAGLVMMLLGGLSMAWADVPLPQMEQITAGQKEKVQAIFDQQQRNFAEACTSVKLLKASALSVAEPIMVAADGKLTAGHWRVRYDVDACGKAGLRTVDMHVVPGGIAIEPLTPGGTLADAKLQADVAHSFAMAGYVAMPQCTQDPMVRDTKVQIYPGTAKERWQEIWIGSMCGRDLGQVVEFLPTKNGTTFKMSLPVKAAKAAPKAAQ